MTHRQQETGYSCGAACLAMVLGIPEAEARRLARTTRRGTYLRNVASAVLARGGVCHTVTLNRPLEECLWFLEAQSMRWPLILSCTFRYTGQTASGKLRGGKREHALVLWQGKSYDPGEADLLDADCIGHLGDRGIQVRDYILVETAK